MLTYAQTSDYPREKTGYLQILLLYHELPVNYQRGFFLKPHFDEVSIKTS